MNEPTCGDCGSDDDVVMVECCHVYLCWDCKERHEVRWGLTPPPQDGWGYGAENMEPEDYI